MTRIISLWLVTVFSLTTLAALPAQAQVQSPDDVVWLQIEAQPSLTVATQSAREYAVTLEDVNGFSLGGGWYAVAVGPYRRSDAEAVRRAYVRDRIVPRDSFIQTSESFRQQFWPIGANVLNRGVIEAPLTELAATDGDQTQTAAAEVPEAPVIKPADETVAEARRSERALTKQERKDLQIALQWAGFYTAAIDGSYGRGTRASMSAWQTANNFEPTGVLTTMQRVALYKQYNAVLDGLGLDLVRNDQAGIEMIMPTAEVEFSRFEPPFAHYDSSGDRGARVLLISQRGDQNTLFGLYDIMQTLEIVPLEGPRERKNASFKLVGENSSSISETHVSLETMKLKALRWSGPQVMRIVVPV